MTVIQVETDAIDEAKKEIVRLRADNTYLAKFLLDLREKLALFVHEIEDEGDRVYLGSTNHADYLRDAEGRMFEIWCEAEDKISKFAKGRDLYSELRELRAGMERNRELADKAISCVESAVRETSACLIAAAPDLLEVAKAMIPHNLCTTNPNIPDNQVVPLEVTMGELRKIAAIIAKARGDHS